MIPYQTNTIEGLHVALERAYDDLEHLFEVDARVALSTTVLCSVAREAATESLVNMYLAGLSDIPESLYPEVQGQSLESYDSMTVAEQYSFALESGKGIMDKLGEMINAAVIWIGNLLRRVINFFTGSNRPPVSTSKTMEDTLEPYRDTKWRMTVTPNGNYVSLMHKGELSAHSLKMAAMNYNAVIMDLKTQIKTIFPSLRTDSVWVNIQKFARENKASGNPYTEIVAEDFRQMFRDNSAWDHLKKRPMPLTPAEAGVELAVLDLNDEGEVYVKMSGTNVQPDALKPFELTYNDASLLILALEKTERVHHDLVTLLSAGEAELKRLEHDTSMIKDLPRDAVAYPKLYLKNTVRVLREITQITAKFGSMQALAYHDVERQIKVALPKLRNNA